MATAVPPPERENFFLSQARKRGRERRPVADGTASALLVDKPAIGPPGTLTRLDGSPTAHM